MEKKKSKSKCRNISENHRWKFIDKVIYFLKGVYRQLLLMFQGLLFLFTKMINLSLNLYNWECYLLFYQKCKLEWFSK